MLDIAWSELAVIGAVALLVIGPKDLPKAMRTAGGWVRKARALAADFQSSLDQMARESELQELREKLRQAETANLSLNQKIAETVDPDGGLARALAAPPELIVPTLPPPPPPSSEEAAGPPAPPDLAAAPAAEPPAAPSPAAPARTEA